MRMRFELTDSACVWIVTMVLVGFGLLMVFDTSALFSLQQYGSPYHFFLRQVVYAGVGMIAMVMLARTDYATYRRAAPLFLVAGAILLAMVFVPGVGKTIRGARRWIALGPVSIQPSEFVKLIVVYYLAAALSERSRTESAHPFRDYVTYLAVVGVLLAIVYKQKDFGTTVIIAAITFVMFFLGGVKMRYLFATSLCALPALLYALIVYRYRIVRITSFLDPWRDPYGSGFQLIQSLISFGKGGVFGQGFANGKQQLFYLPDAHTDFILAVIAEELGLLGVIAVLLLFLLLLFVGVRVAVRAQDRFGFLLASGITILISLQVVLNVGVVVGALPTKGMVLPFLSYGGSALLTNIAAMGMLLSVARLCVLRPAPTKEAYKRSSRAPRKRTREALAGSPA